MKVLVNISNHPSTGWSKEQKADFTNIYDIPFPNIDPGWDSETVFQLAIEIKHKMIKTLDRSGIELYEDISIMLQGEFSFCYILKELLEEDHYWSFVIPTTERVVTENPDGTKTSTFKFVQWRNC